MSGYAAWHELYPERLEIERQAYGDRGFDFTLDEEFLRQHSLVVFRGEILVDGRAWPLVIIYPPGFPFVRPEVLSPTTSLDRHQNPYQGNLCLLENTETGWTSDMTGAEMVQQATDLLTDSLSRGMDAVHANEVDAPEPRSTYYPYHANTSLLVPEPMQTLPPGSWGQFSIVGAGPDAPFRAVLSKLTVHRPKKGSTETRQVAEALQALFPGPTLSGLWFRASEPPPWFRDYAELCDWARRQLPNFDERLRAHSRAPQAFDWHGIAALGICYAEEGPTRGQFHDTWLMSVLWTDRRDQPHVQVLRPHLLSQQDAFARAPQLAGLRSKKVAIVGLGTLGNDIAVRLGRAGVGTFYLVDHDLVEYGNLARNDFDLRDLGLPKVEAVARRLRAINPAVCMAPVRLRLGGIANFEHPEEDANHLATFARAIADHDLVVGATGDGWVNHLLNRIGHTINVPMLFCWSTNGAWGGEVLRVVPGETACYECLALREQAGDLTRTPQDDPETGPVFPLGCGFPTFTGAVFDTGSIALLATRLAVQTLLHADVNAYPDAPYHYLQWDNRGPSIGDWPDIYRGTIAPHPNCTTCRPGM